jgi:2-isopropylmalate synthase
MQKAVNGQTNDKIRSFRLVNFRVIDEKWKENEAPLSEAVIVIEGPDGAVERSEAHGTGPVHALDRALRNALTKFYPELEHVHLHDYKVRVLGGDQGTAATVRVLIESGDEHDRWGTVGVSPNVIEASWQALVDSIEYKLYKDRKRSVDSPQQLAGKFQ